MNQKSVTMIFLGAWCPVYLPALARFLTFYQSKGVDIYAKTGIAGIEKRESQSVVKTTTGKELKVDGVVAGIGVQPNQELAESAGLRVGNGVLVDEFLRTTDQDIYAAGDVANFYNPALDERVRV
jgi:NAD(P)H-nitrite reductase large subunit